MDLSPDAVIFLELGSFRLNATLVYSWVVMALLVAVAWLATRRLSMHAPSRWQSALEVVVEQIHRQIHETALRPADEYVPLLATLFLFIFTSNLLLVVPGFSPPTGSLSTTTALALVVFVAAPFWGIRRVGVWRYLRNYVEPNVVMLPFNLLGELSRTLALAVRLFGNMMSGTVLGAIIVALTPLFFPIVLQTLGLLTGTIQAYIFAVLAAVYIAAATRAHDEDGRDATG